DPHKHGLQPYGCGCVLFRDPAVGRLYRHDSPYTYFTSTDLHLGEISLECSRPGAAAAALWATQRLLPLVEEGEFAPILRPARAAPAPRSPGAPPRPAARARPAASSPPVHLSWTSCASRRAQRACVRSARARDACSPRLRARACTSRSPPCRSPSSISTRPRS